MIPEIVVGGVLLVLGMLLIMGYGLYIKSPKVDENDYIESCRILFVDVLWFYLSLVAIIYCLSE